MTTDIQGSERSENGLVWTAQSSHSQVWSEVMNQTDCNALSMARELTRLDLVGLPKSSDIPFGNFS